MAIVDDLREDLQRNTRRSKAFSPDIIVLTSLSILAAGNFQFVTGQYKFHNLLQSAVSKIFNEFLDAMLRKSKNYIAFPTSAEAIAKSKRDFYSKYGFPNVVGAIDGTHIVIQKPRIWDAYTFFNRKMQYSINVQAVCNAHFEFTDVVVRWPGSTHDSHIYKNSGLYRFLHSQQFPQNSYLLGDNGYPLQHCLITPVLSPSTPQEERYNKAHKRTRKVIEQSFGILKSRFRILSKSGGSLCYNLRKCTKIILCCFILHNIANKHNVPLYEEEEIDGSEYECNTEDDDNNATDLEQTSSQIRGNIIRRTLFDYEFSN